MFHKTLKKRILTISIFIILVTFASIISNIFYPIYGDCCFVPVTSQRYVIGLPVAVIPKDFGQGVMYGTTFHLKGILFLIFIYLPISMLISKFISKHET